MKTLGRSCPVLRRERARTSPGFSPRTGERGLPPPPGTGQKCVMVVSEISPTLIAAYVWMNSRHERERKDKVTASYKLTYILSGSCTFFIGEKKYELVRDDLFFMPPGVTYSTLIPESNLSLVNIFFDVEKRDQPRQIQRSECFLSEKVGGAQTFTDYPVFNTFFVIGSATARTLIQKIVDELSANRLLSREMICLYIKEILIHAARKNGSTGNERQRMLARQVVSYVGEHLRDRLTSDIIAADLHYNTEYLNRIVKNYTGMTLHGYIIEARLSKAAALLINTETDVTDIALSLCFCSSSHFSAVFRRRFGMSPSEYREVYRELA